MARVVGHRNQDSIVGIRVFPNKSSQSILADRSLIHYQGFAPIYGDRLKAGELPVPDFQGNRPADFFAKQTAIHEQEKEEDIHGHVFTHTRQTQSPVFHYARGESYPSVTSEDRPPEEDSGFFNSNEVETPTPPPTVERVLDSVEEVVEKVDVVADIGTKFRTFGESLVGSVLGRDEPGEPENEEQVEKVDVVEDVGTKFRTFGSVLGREEPEEEEQVEKVDVVVDVETKFRTFGVSGEIGAGSDGRAEMHVSLVEVETEHRSRSLSSSSNNQTNGEGQGPLSLVFYSYYKWPVRNRPLFIALSIKKRQAG